MLKFTFLLTFLFAVIVFLSASSLSYADSLIRNPRYIVNRINKDGVKAARLTFDKDNKNYKITDYPDLNDKPDTIKIYDKNVDEILLAGEEKVNKKYGDLYRQVRDELLYDNIRKFRALMINEGHRCRIYNRSDVESQTVVALSDSMGNYFHAVDIGQDGSTDMFVVTDSSADSIISILVSPSERTKIIISNIVQTAITTCKGHFHPR